MLKEFSHIWNDLSEREREILRMREGKIPYSKIGTKFGITGQGVRYIEARIYREAYEKKLLDEIRAKSENSHGR